MTRQSPDPEAKGVSWTPGPWRVSTGALGFQSIRTGERNSDPDSDLIADVYGDDGSAHLISAAPELYEAALLAAPHGDRLLHGPNVSISADAYRALCAALAKANPQ